MDIASSYAATQSAQLQESLALLMIKQQASAGQSVAAMLEQAMDTTQAILASPGPGIGAILDQTA